MAEQEYVEGPDWFGGTTRMPVGSYCDYEQYHILKECSRLKSDFPWREYESQYKNQRPMIVLQGADLKNFWLQGLNMYRPNFQYAYFRGAQLQGTQFLIGDLSNAFLYKANLQRTLSLRTNMKSAHFREARLQYAFVVSSNLQNADFTSTQLQHAAFTGCNCEHASFAKASLQGTKLLSCYLGEASLVNDKIDTKTDFSRSGLETAMVCPELHSQLEYNIRRKYWLQWTKGKRNKRLGLHPKWDMRPQTLSRIFVHWPVRLFWGASDYGTSSIRLLLVFLGLAIIFATIYCLPLGLVTLSDGGELRNFWHAIYFSVVTMTTLGFGDIYANPDSWIGQGVLMLQVFLGYILLGAFVTRFGIMFMSKAPCPYVARAKHDQWRRRVRAWDIYWTRRILRQPASKLRRPNRGKDSSSHGDGPAKTETR